MSQRHRQPPVADNPIANSNSTSNYFLAGQSRPWMGISNHTTSRPFPPPNLSASSRGPSRNTSSPLQLTPITRPSDVSAPLAEQQNQTLNPQSPPQSSTQPVPHSSHLPTFTIPAALDPLPSAQAAAPQLEDSSEHVPAEPIFVNNCSPSLPASSSRQTAAAEGPVISSANNAFWAPTANPLTHISSNMGPARQPPHGHVPPMTPASQAVSPMSTTQLPTPNSSPVTHLEAFYTTALESSLNTLKRAGLWETAQDGALDTMRVRLLQEACSQDDVFYLTVHSIYLMTTCSQDEAQSLALDTTHEQGLLIVQALLGSNRLLSPNIQQLFINFRPANLLRQPIPLLPDIKVFLAQLPDCFSLLREQAKARGSPPSPSELKYRLQITSPVLVKALFLSILRDWPFDLEWEIRAQWLLRYWSDPAREPQLPTSLSHVQSITLEFTKHYQQIRNQYHHERSRPIQNQSHQDNQSAQMPSHHPQTVSQPRPRSRPQRAIAPTLPQTSPAAQVPQHRLTGIGATTNSLDPHPARTVSYGHARPSQPQLAHHSRLNASSHIYPVHGSQEQGPSQRFFPSNDAFRLPISFQPRPQETAAHQALSSSPKYNITELDGISTPPERLYRYVEDIIMLPHTFVKETALVRCQVTIPPPLLFTKVMPPRLVGSFLSPESDVMCGSTQFRLKCMKQDLNSASDPAFLPTFWPALISISVNGTFNLDIRRKAHYGNDQSMDITHLLQDGDNEIVVGISFATREANLTFLVGIEVIRIKSPASVAAMPQHLPSVHVKASIAAAIAANGDSDDDDLVVADTGISIFLLDPITSQMCVTPVRSRKCQHRECFDLNAFLLSRTSRVKGRALTDPVQWKCPICNQDARPQNLIIDDFLVQVRESLEKQGLLETRTILVKGNGDWEVRGGNISAGNSIKSHASRVKTDEMESALPLDDRNVPSSVDDGPEIITINDD
ncbi:hypothetical protein B0A52_01037 [Exophiala mesophila]|uniref:SP-RING-type domain-containing protein n=1 Tax=Exophiala mesophila TaxID=212818 RepID=A0A438NGB0_EXOME|nr:hypothetical protein B0A52_01037 [Exophiala mesophila]